MTIKFSLDSTSIKQAAKEYQAWMQEVNERIEKFVEQLAKTGADVAKVKFASAVYSGDMSDITVGIDNGGTKATVYATGQAVAFIEFGTGIAYPEHPSGMYHHGTYGQGKGNNPNGWVYYGVAGNNSTPIYKNGQQIQGIWRTKGNPPANAMWDATAKMAASVKEIWEKTMV